MTNKSFRGLFETVRLKIPDIPSFYYNRKKNKKAARSMEKNNFPDRAAFCDSDSIIVQKGGG
ncbi:hypothetical protein [Lentibacillus salicampi]|uniref:Uncharacterized protein n=1 Tax=Lentibacillus salicampi TaxID=175306 RepID=A0A4Y9ACK1_9BACI|nr:hypothetical protein [Lentibacillus salicampi]TFJ92640.1 hypothetical protein E4U82_11385 [Lentibacillus salicampi]